MSMISDNLASVNAQIHAACEEFGRKPQSVRLLAVSKTFPHQAVREAYAAGQRSFGENYIQEGVEKTLALVDLPDIEWHMIGPIQSNKTRLVAEHFHWVHSVDRLKIAQRLSEQRPVGLPALQVCLQVNIDGGPNKSGCLPSEAVQLARDICQLQNLQLRGLMVIPEPAPDFIAACAVLMSAKQLFDSIKEQIPGLDTLSMGMSADLRAAVKEGSTMVRVGTAIFGTRV
ncbi:YggS family pyridoxal phosphate-dependent enzyme [Variovorax sp. PCZ-1]|uniref:YggS family pyridoxal phosphate-dependent enzyme n=1 Tax=Variovorax sp. PCZ-1 TaxID=2835533 RepID=UPI001BCB2D0D|nr:YggS family pyridoxal phosphate-dependent enzyme [Variovorax sp. PCZ-1]MBS7806458.1 YggS family pyridoxal phosphate-dependent enzyme [Variovorax sp. PCZ-1]